MADNVAITPPEKVSKYGWTPISDSRPFLLVNDEGKAHMLIDPEIVAQLRRIEEKLDRLLEGK
jgi:hypothetical protein